MTINEARSELGLPLFTFPEADMPFVSSLLLPAADAQEILEGDGADVEPAGTADPQREGAEGNATVADSKAGSNKSIELAAFTRWTKGARTREFVFEWLDVDKAKALNTLAIADPQAARDFALTLKTSEADIKKFNRDKVDKALAKLDALPMVDDEHIEIMWPVYPRPKLDRKVWASSEIEALKIKKLYASQKLLDKKQVKKFIESQGAPDNGHRALANVYAIDDHNVIVDGHHRLAALWLLGAEVANVWFLEE